MITSSREPFASILSRSAESKVMLPSLSPGSWFRTTAPLGPAEPRVPPTPSMAAPVGHDRRAGQSDGIKVAVDESVPGIRRGSEDCLLGRCQATSGEIEADRPGVGVGGVKGGGGAQKGGGKEQRAHGVNSGMRRGRRKGGGASFLQLEYGNLLAMRFCDKDKMSRHRREAHERSPDPTAGRLRSEQRTGGTRRDSRPRAEGVVDPRCIRERPRE